MYGTIEQPPPPSAATKPFDHVKIKQQADTAYINGNWEQAEQIYTELIKHLPQTAESWLNLGNIYAHTRRYSAAIDAYRQALALNPEDIKAWNNLGIVQLREVTDTFIKMQRYIEQRDPLYQWVDDILTIIHDSIEQRLTITDDGKS